MHTLYRTYSYFRRIGLTPVLALSRAHLKLAAWGLVVVLAFASPALEVVYTLATPHALTTACTLTTAAGSARDYDAELADAVEGSER